MSKEYYETPRKEAITKIIHSVACEQDSLAKILEAEAEKVKKVLEISKSEKDILAVNDSVQNTINAITKLELVLSSKLELFKCCLCDIPKKKNLKDETES